MIALSSSAVASDAVSAVSGTDLGSDATEAAPPQPARTKLSASAPKKKRFTELRVCPGVGAGLLDRLGLVVHLGRGAVEAVTGDSQPHLEEQLARAE